MLIVEDGTGLPDAESYASAATASSHFAKRGVDAWGELSEDAKDAALRNATDYMEAVFGLLWRSVRKTEEQALSWPRVGWGGVPEPVIRACCELALKASTGPLLPDQAAQVKQETVGPITVVYQDGARQGTYYAYVNEMLRPLLRSADSLDVVRA
ncbi:DnaT-like ssDNA-binding protein [Lysobacter enzymogenes]|uniref:DnaT-like ssDNA-binding protein n=1 Tax=Lysobacter enzymogenes TaxID=69 RepID=UPI001A96E086|nr:DnaT-like ssDNA-binding protein [Lysobacter enzymogenes]QQP97929.1 hypothetical protein JHW38_07980 [Lysobacter enzymogenes]